MSFLSACATPQKQNKAESLNNVSYSSVTTISVTEPDEVYPYGDDLSQQIWYYAPSQYSEFKGVVALIHGGCWLSQFDIAHTQALSNALSDAGFAVWNIEYRRTGNGGEWPIALTDIQAAISELSRQKGDDLDLSSISIVGHSAGGHLAMLASARPEALNLPESTQIKTVGLAPIIDIEAYSLGDNSCQTATPKFMQGTVEERKLEYAQASVLNSRFSKDFSYVLIGGNDVIVPAEYSSHDDTQLIRVEQAGHFDWIHPRTEAFKQLLFVLEKK